MLMDFFRHIFEIEPTKRISIQQIMKHGLMKEEETKMASESPNTTASSE